MAQPIDAPDLPARYASLADFREGARRRLPHFVFEYLDGGIGRDVGLSRNYAALDRIRITPRNVDEGVAPDTSTTILGQKAAFPFCVAPVGMTGLFHPDAATSLERKSAKLGVPFCLSFVGSHTAAEIKGVAGRAPWHQYYWPRPEAAQTEILKQMKDVGVDVLMPTLDIPGHQWRERTIRAGVSAKPSPLVLARDLIRRPAWALDIARRGKPGLPNIQPFAPGDALTAERWLLENCLRPIGTEEIKRLRDRWDGKIVVKGVMSPEDAEAFAKVGVDGVVVSNHGGRQLDAAPGGAELLPPIVEAVKGKVAIIADSGVADGLDVLKMMRLGADFVMVGRLAYYACAALGGRGANVLDMLALQVRTVMVQLGVRSFDELAALRVDID